MSYAEVSKNKKRCSVFALHPILLDRRIARERIVI